MNQRHKTLYTILTALGLQKKQLERKIYPLNDDILNKKRAVSSLEVYSTEYKNQLLATSQYPMSNFLNHQHFLDKLSSVLYSEKQSLSRLDAQHAALLKEYHQLDLQIEGIQEMLTLQRQALQTLQDKHEDVQCTELLTHAKLRTRRHNDTGL
jgi:chromosome segregation ATPase